MAKSYRFYEFSVLKCNSNESATKGDNAMSKKIRTEAVDYLFQGILSLEDKEECYTFFEDICTINELLSLSQRFEVAKMLREHKTYLEIAEKTGLSQEYVQKNAELSPKKGLFAYAFAGRDITGKSVEDMVYEAQRKVILELADKESCVIIGRNADFSAISLIMFLS